jgi:magnesium chelatase subunit I
MPISGIELLVSNLERRQLATGDDPVVPRICDLHMLLPSLTGKVEMVYEGEQKGVEVVARQLIGEAVKKVFADRFQEVGREVGSGGEDDVGPYSGIVAWFAGGGRVTLSDEQPFVEYEKELAKVPGLLDLAAGYGDGSREQRALGAEMILEGLHQHLKLAREDLDSRIRYQEMVKFQLLRSRRVRSAEGDDFN